VTYLSLVRVLTMNTGLRTSLTGVSICVHVLVRKLSVRLGVVFASVGCLRQT
jgi:hypothetical protein